MYWIPWISFATWDGLSTKYVNWRRLTKYRVDGNHRWSPIILGRPRWGKQPPSFTMKF